MNALFMEACALQDELTEYRRELHRIPELGLQLPKTAAFICKKLEEFGIPYHLYPEISCITAVLGRGEKCFLLRSDIDALPIRETSSEAYASENENMHACGHDMHAAVLLGAARLLKAHESELKGKVKLLFQAGEETFTGAEAAMNAGVLEDPHVDAGFAMHVASTAPVGLIGYGDKPMSSCYGFKITLTGKGAHGSTPELGIDPIAAAAQLYLAYQELIAREIPASAEAVLTVGMFNAGTAPNIIPDTAELQGTLRTFNEDVRKYLIQRMHETAEYVAKTYRCTASFDAVYDVPDVRNDPDITACVIEAAEELETGFKVMNVVHTMGSEDFAFISHQLKTAYFIIGAGVDDPSKRVAHHNAGVVFNEKCLAAGAAVYAKTAMKWLEKHG